MSSSFVFTLFLFGAITNARASMGTPGEADTADAERSLEGELASNTTAARLKEIQEELRPMFAALPKGKNGHLGHQVVRYVLHRLFMKRHGWFIRGLEPSSTEPPPYMKKDWVPAYLQGLLELRFGDSGIDLRELSALAATLEDLVHQEVVSRLEAVFEGTQTPTAGPLTEKDLAEIVSSYAMLWIQVRGDRFTNLTPQSLKDRRAAYAEKYEHMPQAEQWWTALLQKHLAAAGPIGFDFASTSRILDDFGQRFSEYNEHECQDLKGLLVSLEDPDRVGSGRVLAKDYWAKGRYSYWRFTEPIEKLRDLGLLDESDPAKPSIILANYVASRNNCLASSSLYEVCCRNECEVLLSHFEENIGAPSTTVARVAELVESLPSGNSTTRLSDSLRQQLNEIGANNGGKVSLHGRPFARWMHFVRPRECPFPHEAGVVANPETADEWIGEVEDEEEGVIAQGSAAVAVDDQGNTDQIGYMGTKTLDDAGVFTQSPGGASFGQDAPRSWFTSLFRFLIFVVVVLALVLAFVPQAQELLGKACLGLHAPPRVKEFLCKGDPLQAWSKAESATFDMP